MLLFPLLSAAYQNNLLTQISKFNRERDRADSMNHPSQIPQKDPKVADTKAYKGVRTINFIYDISFFSPKISGKNVAFLRQQITPPYEVTSAYQSPPQPSVSLPPWLSLPSSA